MLASVIIEYNVKSLNKVFDYKIPNYIKNLMIGNKVLVPFGKTKVEGFVMDIHNNIDKNIDYKEIIDVINPLIYLKKDLIELGKYISEKTFCNIISAYQVMFPKALKASAKTNINKKYISYIVSNRTIEDLNKYIEDNKRNKKELEIINKIIDNIRVLKKEISGSSLNSLLKKEILKEIKEEVNRNVNFTKEEKKEITLTEEQNNAYESIIKEKNNNKFLLFGVTGSGKTEVYIKIIKYYLKQNKTAILLVPEISLTPQIVSRFKNEFDSSVAVLHSRLSEGEKYDEYRKIINKKVQVVVGARSAIFAPLDNLGVIIIDECQSASYKQESTPKYNTIDVALKRSELTNSKIILGSATPSLEEYARSKKGLYKLVPLTERINKTLPEVILVDMEKEVKKRNFIISDELNKKIIERLSKNEQVILMLNRRGFSTFISCSSCGYVYKCPNCDISLTYHKSSNNLRCHYCGYSIKKDNICPSCKNDTIKDLGLGTEKLEKIIMEKYKTAKVLRMDYDTTSLKGSHEKLINSFKNREYDILIGTQMISKGLNFPNVTLVGVINADASLSIPNYKSSERTFELLMQTGGRSGRNDLTGEVIIQTYNPDNYVLKYIKKYDFESFYNYEMEIRKKLRYPPYFYMLSIKIISPDYNLARDESQKIKNYLSKILNETFIILGPSIAAFFKVNNNYNFQIIIKYKKEYNLYEILKNLNNNYLNKKIKIDIETNI